MSYLGTLVFVEAQPAHQPAITSSSALLIRVFIMVFGYMEFAAIRVTFLGWEA